MPPKVQQKTKEQKMAAAMAGSKSKKKKWSKGKSRDKVLNEVLFKDQTYERMMQEVPKMKLITTSLMVERLKINGSLARAAMRELEEQGVIRLISKNSLQLIYTRSTNTDA